MPKICPVCHNYRGWTADGHCAVCGTHFDQDGNPIDKTGRIILTDNKGQPIKSQSTSSIGEAYRGSGDAIRGLAHLIIIASIMVALIIGLSNLSYGWVFGIVVALVGAISAVPLYAYSSIIINTAETVRMANRQVELLERLLEKR